MFFYCPLGKGNKAENTNHQILNKMKKVFIFIAFMVAIAANAQQQNSGLGFNYQAVVRNSNGVLLANTMVNLRVSLYPGQYAIAPTWVEIHNDTTDMSGCFGITVGKGERDNSSVVENYSDVNFSAIYYWLKIEILEGNVYREISYSQLPSAPYSEVAHNAIFSPAGVVSPFAGPVENIPAGWLLCDGSEISRTEYANLYDAIGVCWGVGDGSTTFNLPDLRGLFLRGVSGDSGNDTDADERLVLNDNGGNTGNQVGSYQGDAIRNITGHFNAVENYDLSCGGAFYSYYGQGVGSGRSDHDNHFIGFDASLEVPVGSDNRPKNAYVNYIIKY